MKFFFTWAARKPLLNGKHKKTIHKGKQPTGLNYTKIENFGISGNRKTKEKMYLYHVPIKDLLMLYKCVCVCVCMHVCVCACVHEQVHRYAHLNKKRVVIDQVASDSRKI